MKILSIRPSPGGSTLARFDLQLNDHLRLFNLALRQRGVARCRTVAPNAFNERAAAFGEQFNRARFQTLPLPPVYRLLKTDDLITSQPRLCGDQGGE